MPPHHTIKYPHQTPNHKRPTAVVALADDRSPNPNHLPFIHDDPSTTPPSLSSSTTFSNTNQDILISVPSNANPTTRLASSREPEASPQTASNQVLGRRRRGTSPPTTHLLETSEGQPLTGTEPSRKRRRQESRMRAEGDLNNSNGTAKPFLHGLHKTALQNSTNGARRSSLAMNGSSHTNGKPKSSYFGHDREEVTRILIQALTDLGYNSAAGSLSKESGYDLESPTVAAFRNAVLQGEWAEAESLLFGVDGPSEEGGVNIRGNGLVLAEGMDENIMRFWLRQQKFLELLEQRNTSKALTVLRYELTPLYHDTAKLHFLSSLLMCHSIEDLKMKADWDGAFGESRHHLLSDLSKCISPSVMLPEHRLAVLLQQVKRNQISNCTYHNTATSPSLYQDHTCDRNNFPLRTVLELDDHTGEVWQVQFSHDGQRLASCGGDGTAIIYNVENWSVLQILKDHGSGVGSLSWSPDDSMIVTCSQDKRARLWNTETGELLLAQSRVGEPVTSCVWAPDGQTFVIGCLAKEGNLCQWDTRGNLVYDWSKSHRIQDLAVSPNGNRLVAMDNSNHIHVYNFVTRELEYDLDLKVNLSCISISQNSRYLLINKTDGETRMLEMDTRETVRMFLSSTRTGEFAIRSAFGGANESFVIAGSEDGNVYIFHKENGTLVEKLDGHSHGCCNAVSWNPVNPCMFASAGDDCKVRIWSNDADEFKPSRALRTSNGHERGSNGRY